MAPWNALRQSRSTGTSARSRRPPGAGTCSPRARGFLFVDDAGSIQELAQPEGDRTDVRMNDGACDPQGRFWAGTMAHLMASRQADRRPAAAPARTPAQAPLRAQSSAPR